MNILVVVGKSIDGDTSTDSFKRTIIKELNSRKYNITVVQYSRDGLHKINIFNKNKIKFVDGSLSKNISDYLNLILYNKTGIAWRSKFNNWEKNYPESFIKAVTKSISGHYDVVLSISHPAFSHRVVYDLITKKIISYDKWNQIWFETWFDFFNKASKSSKLIHDEKKLLKYSDKIYYPSPILVEDHKQEYPEYSNRMKEFFLPSYPIKTINSSEKVTINYLGSYHSKVRNLIPFYNVVVKKGYSSTIVGNTDLKLENKKNVNVISKRISEEESLKYERESTLLVVLLNSFAEIIPGKLYKYATWDKPILVILDGSNRVKNYVIQTFGKYQKVYFANNDQKSIYFEIKRIIKEYNSSDFKPIKDFYPEKVIDMLIK